VKRYVYMNHRIRQANPKGPVIVVQDADGGVVEADGFAIVFDGFLIGHVVFDPNGLKVCKTHDVKAWVEFTDAVELVPSGTPPRQAASEKKPNKVVRVDSLKISK